MFRYKLTPTTLDPNIKIAFPTRHDTPKECTYHSVRFAGKAEMIKQLYDQWEDALPPYEHISPLPDGFEEVSISSLSWDELSTLLKNFPYLKCTGIIEYIERINRYSEVQTFFSESGYPFITDVQTQFSDDDVPADPSEGFAEDVDVLTPRYDIERRMHNGWTNYYNYSYPYIERWEAFRYILPDESGALYATAAENALIIRNNVLLRCEQPSGDIVLPEGLRSIDPIAFSHHRSGSYHGFNSSLDITSVIVPDSLVPDWSENPFKYCNKLTEPLYNRSRTALIYYPPSLKDTHFDVPATVKHIAGHAFNTQALTSVTLPEGLESIGRYAFSGEGSRLFFSWTTSFENLTIPSTVRRLDGIFIRKNLTILNDLDWCGGIKCENLIIKGSIHSFESGRYIDAKTLEIDGTFPEAALPTDSSLSFICAPRMPFTAFPAELRKAAIIGFAKAYVQDIYIAPDIRTTYLTYLRRQKKRLYELCPAHPDLMRMMMSEKIIPAEDVDKLCALFEAKNMVEEVAELLNYSNTLPRKKNADDDLSLDDLPKKSKKPFDPFSPTEIRKEWTFEKLADGTIRLTGCKSAETDLYIPPRVGKDPVTELCELLLSPNKPRLSAAFKEARQSTYRVEIPDGIKVLGKGIFSDCTALNTILIPASVTDIQDNAFRGCTALTDIELAEGSPYFIENGVMYAPTEGGVKAVWAQKRSACTLREDTVSLAPALFEGHTALTALTLPEGLTEISDCAFSGCTALTAVTLPEGLTSIGASAFFGCKSLTGITLPQGLTTLGSYAFAESGLTAINIPSGIQTIGEYAFETCAALQTAILNEGTVCIGKRAFRNCEALTQINFPSTLTTVGAEAFRQCMGFKVLDIPETVTDIQHWGFACCYNAVFHVRAGSVAHTYAAENFYPHQIILPSDS